MALRFTHEVLQKCYEQIASLRNDAILIEKNYRKEIYAAPPEYRESVKNLLHYIALRRHDIRSLQVQLGYLGLSSLGRLEAHVLAGLDSVLAALQKMSDRPLQPTVKKIDALHFKEGDRQLAQQVEKLMGQIPKNRNVRIMVTLPIEAAVDPVLVKNLVAYGMDIARINSAHDDPGTWLKMVKNVQKASKALQRECRLMMDLSGPKLRTGALAAGPKIIHINPVRNDYGLIPNPARVMIVSESNYTNSPHRNETVIPIDDMLKKQIRIGDQIVLRDKPGRLRHLNITEQIGSNWLAEAWKSIYLESGMLLELQRENVTLATGHVAQLPEQDTFLLLKQDELLKVTGPEIPGKPSRVDSNGHILEPASIPCTLPEVFKDLNIGERIFFDDGKIAGIIETVNSKGLTVRITRARDKGVRLRGDKGINLPDSNLKLPALSEYDLRCLDFAVEHTDIIGYSFVRNANDVKILHKALSRRTEKELGIVLKIENRMAFENLPSLLMTGLKKPPLGVMVARGDLGVELGFERMAEVQEQILWLCESAHVPVIWATQVLEQMNKTGMPTRGEVTDAAMSSRAECVMLNKGPYLVETVTLLQNILIRMQDHHQKKTPMLRKLKVSEGRWSAFEENKEETSI